MEKQKNRFIVVNQVQVVLKAKGMFKVIILKNTLELAFDEYKGLLQHVSLEKQERIRRFHVFLDAQNCLIGDILARMEICQITGLRNEELEFAVNLYGKPFLKNKPQIHYNISHAGTFTSCALSDQPVGIDIECVKEVDMRIAGRFFTAEEATYILSEPEDMRRRQRFFEVWTKKESRIKWEGKGLTKPLNSFNTLNSAKQTGVFYHCIYNNTEAIGHVCSNKKEKPTIKIIDTKTLLQHIKIINKT